jgi:uncharacterized protein
VHPESYPLVERILADIKKGIREVIGDSTTVRALSPVKYADETFGLPTVQDILQELEKPGRDPRPEFKAAAFREGIEALKDLEPGMLLEGVVTNVTNFGAFVDIGGPSGRAGACVRPGQQVRQGPPQRRQGR